MKLALGPVPYYWTRTAVLEYYDAVRRAPVDIVYLGEVVCSRRHELRLADWLEIAAALEDAGKEAVLSTQALLESESDLKTLRRIAANGRFRVEANDYGAVRLMKERPGFVAGASLNIYNPETLRLLASAGATRWMPPAELSRTALAALQHERPDGVETELFVYGRLPLAHSARCFTARHFNLQKDDCRFRCLDFPEGLLLRTAESRPLFMLNGVQIQSAAICNLVGDLPAMAELGIDVIRIDAAASRLEAVTGLVRRALESPSDAHAVAEALDRMNGESCDGYWYGRAGMEAVRATVRRAEAQL